MRSRSTSTSRTRYGWSSPSSDSNNGASAGRANGYGGRRSADPDLDERRAYLIAPEVLGGAQAGAVGQENGAQENGAAAHGDLPNAPAHPDNEHRTPALDATDDEAPEPAIGREAAPAFDPEVVWQMLLSELALQMPTATYDTWVRDTVVMGYEDGEFIIGMPNAYARDWLENRLRHTIKRTLSSIMQRSVQIQFRVRPRPIDDAERVEGAPLYRAAVEEPSPAEPIGSKQTTVVDPADGRLSSTQLNPHHTFETFVVGNHNRLAHAAALAIVDTPGQTFNPLFIYGGVGLGKTHLLNAIGNGLRQKGYRLLYCSSEQFTNELISAIRNQNTEQFRNKYRQVDALLIDDIQFIGGKESTQEEFFHTFNHLHAAGRQVVVSSDRPPKALATLEERLRSRFEGGLQTDIAQPDFETRVAILQSKANRMGVTVPYDVLMLIAERVDSNIRELEGALNGLFMKARLTNTPANLALARSLLENLAPKRVPCTPADVIRLVAQHYNLRAEDLTGRKRTKEVANARQIAMYLLREENDLSLPVIGEHLGGRDHSTVRYGVEQVNKELERDEGLRMTIMTLREKVYAPAA
jgi:chromosomal replication initiator protein